MSGTRQIAQQRDRWFKKHPYCYWCGVKLVQGNSGGGFQPDNEATIDHLRSRFDPTRRSEVYGVRRRVLACHKCNWGRGESERKQLPSEEIWRRSKSWPMLSGMLAWDRMILEHDNG